MAKFLKERLVDTSDAYTCYICDMCGSNRSKTMYKITLRFLNEAR